ncbi:MAG: hypothetical protein JW908_02815 [Anaerolineales bacterium]|nr:hypothetical protein [Anaerolineales bacterium]
MGLNKTTLHKKLIPILFLATALIIIAAIPFSLSQAGNLLQEKLEEYYAFMPVIMNKSPLQTVFGVTMKKFNAESGVNQIAEAGISWAREDFIWESIEPTEGERNWDTTLEQELITAATLNIKPIMVIGGTPDWALKAGFPCGAVAQDKFPALGEFVYDLVKRYSAPPYYIRYWELWNEPDAAGILGCWGDTSDPNYYGGEYYGQMLQFIYPYIKAADPQAQVLVGGLLLDCDPVNPPYGMDCTSSNFIKGILESGAGNSFDGVSFHAYDYFSGLGTYNFVNWNSSSSETGPSAIAKGRYLKSALNQYGFGSKYLMSTETAVFYGPNVPTPPCAPDAPAEVEVTKVYHLIHSFASAIAEGYKTNIWYSAIGVRCSGLLNTDLSTKPAYEAYKFAYSKLGDAAFTQQITLDAQVMGYEYRLSNRKLWVLWSKDGADHAVTLPKMPLVVNKVGSDGMAVQETNTTSLTVGINPYFIEFTN